MKQLKGSEKIIFFINSLVAAVLLLSYLLPYVAPKNFAFLSVLSLAVPLLIILNALFMLYWLLKAKKQLLLSGLVLLLGYSYVGSLYKFSSSKNVEEDNNISIMNYNVRLFNLYNWIDSDSVEQEIIELIKDDNPDVISFQEYHPHERIDLSFYKYKYEKLSGNRVKYGQAIFSKYPIIGSGSVEFPNTANNAIFADIVKQDDTIRIYNLHLQSLHIDANVENLKKEDSEKLINKVSETFKMQQEQAELFIKHKEHSPYKMVICGDFNNSPYSYVYKEIKDDLKDSFEEAGNGFGRTFNFKYFPVRIDFILVDDAFEVNSFKVFEEKLSDHYPIRAKVSLHK
ncbi:endonuclease/exonuclease/phosphatase family protein [Flavobacteriaceae bacterium S0825]|uniref:endonuclease/exonuclease/phosphatase family protein n=1 Tax=Gaetbulibacter sp. S0825 TaxID=2720084 RepID=UPI0014320C85|nr:endonuclease/exonuclease/phosphatase family protein [Gaetbulibacter sp. S0825]MCK0110090.1 endonuclease/exonuclease/phosphatase family protein [Flavobacteriaceae bacterium S0825]NIX65719.1 endonuclease/exonuclease/phosphatase family protein [Gaetbulibacter sp. S0825]